MVRCGRSFQSSPPYLGCWRANMWDLWHLGCNTMLIYGDDWGNHPTMASNLDPIFPDMMEQRNWKYLSMASYYFMSKYIYIVVYRLYIYICICTVYVCLISYGFSEHGLYTTISKIMTIHGNWGYSTILDLRIGQRQKLQVFITRLTVSYVFIYIYTYSMIFRETIVIQ